MKTDAQIVREANSLARDYYAMMGYTVKAGYRFDQATHPQERLCWNMAALAFEALTLTDVTNALEETE